jgi:hypothetical protein
LDGFFDRPLLSHPGFALDVMVPPGNFDSVILTKILLLKVLLGFGFGMIILALL